jgi:hypothetical protein
MSFRSTRVFFRASAFVFFVSSVSSYFSLLSLPGISPITDIYAVIVRSILFLTFVAPSGLMCKMLYNISNHIEKYQREKLLTLFFILFIFHLPYYFSLYCTFLMNQFYGLFIWFFFIVFQLFLFIIFFVLKVSR